MRKLLVVSIAWALMPTAPLAQTAAAAEPGAAAAASQSAAQSAADAPAPEVKGKAASGGSKTEKAKTASPPRKGKKG